MKVAAVPMSAANITQQEVSPGRAKPAKARGAPRSKGGTLRRAAIRLVRSICGDLSLTHVPYLLPGHDRHEKRWQRLIGSIKPISLEQLALVHPAGTIEHHVPCHLCGESTVQPLFSPGNARWHYHVVRCPFCGFIYRNPTVRPDRLGDLYSKNYAKNLLSDDHIQWRLRHYHSFLQAFSPMFADGAGRKLLDFGCGVGIFMELAKSLGFDVWGVDLAADSIAAARKRLGSHQAFCGHPMDVPEIAAGGFDVITLWSVLAHLPEPVIDFKMLRNLLKPGGMLVVFTVNANSLLLKTYREKWNGFTPNHLCFYSASTLKVLSQRTGFNAMLTRPYYGDGVEFGKRTLPAPLANRIRRVIDATDQGNMMRAVLIADGG